MHYTYKNMVLVNWQGHTSSLGPENPPYHKHKQKFTAKANSPNPLKFPSKGYWII